ncbi:rubrerythrin family protein [Acetonema longum]|uniref:Rubrerythrin n=1 Tax=Acetonema longum DSM 6540 TaxID=1009370 RepID=F7NME7_9FIRM|nr:rubrerythrin family protein [Acetonema longum]EGO62792.1 rubrerythrin [Acetonema longum DSM 6540]
MPVKNAMTADFLRSAYGGESMAHMRYLTWAEDAEKKEMPNIGRLFRAVSYAEQVHAFNHFRELGQQTGGATVTAGAEFGMGSVAENLQWAIDGEVHEVEQMYPVYFQVAQCQQESGAQRSFHYALEAEKIHVTMFKAAQDAAKAGKDLPTKDYYVCPVCGFTGEGHMEDQCPVCKVKKELFKVFSA